MNTISKIENVDLYLKEFSILNFVDSLKIIASCWAIYGNNRKRSTEFFTSLYYSNSIKPDGYLLLEKFLSHENLMTSSFKEEYTSKEDVDKWKVSNSDWANAKKIQGEMSHNILTKYCENKHKSVLTSINYLNELELKYLNEIFNLKIREIKYNKNIFSTIHKDSNHPINFEVNSIINIITYNLINDLKIVIENEFGETTYYGCSDFLTIYKKNKTKCKNNHNLNENELFILTEIIDENISEIEFYFSHNVCTCKAKKNRPDFSAENKIILKLINLDLLNNVKFKTESSLFENNTRWFTGKELIEFLKNNNYNTDDWNIHLF